MKNRFGKILDVNKIILLACCNITDGRCRQSVKMSRDWRVRAEWPAKLDVILK